MRITSLILLLTALLLSGCTNVFFQPMKPLVRTPTEIGLEYRDVNFKSSDDVQLHGWFLPSRTPAKASVLFFHGNAENISTHIGSVYWLPEHGVNVLLVDYRGYGQSESVAELGGAYRDANAAIDTFLTLPEVQNTRHIIFGQSLGGAIALHAVANSPCKNEIDTVIIESAFSSFRGIAREKLDSFWLTWPLQWPLSFLVSDKYKPLNAAPQISPIPLHFMHSSQDRVVPISHSEKLYNAAKEPKTLWTTKQGRHIGLVQQEAYRRAILKYILGVE